MKRWPLLIQYQSRVCVILTHNKVYALQDDTIDGYVEVGTV
jgi:hypothetical protein